MTNYNNYYEFSTEKDEPAKLAKNFRTRPWKVKIDGLVDKKQELDVDTILKMAPPEERIYRHRCVEGWSIVVPWVGFSLSELIKRVNPTSKAKFVEFTTILDMTQMPGQQRNVLRVALRRRPAHGRSHASAGAALLRHVRRGSSQSGWRAAAHRGAVEVWLQEREGDCAHSFHRQAAAEYLEYFCAHGIRLLFQRESAMWTIRAGARPKSAASANSSSARP